MSMGTMHKFLACDLVILTIDYLPEISYNVDIIKGYRTVKFLSLTSEGKNLPKKFKKPLTNHTKRAIL